MYRYYPKNVCSKEIDLEIENDIIKSVNFIGGCPGSLLGISKLVCGMKVADVISLFADNKCGPRETSCPQELAKALKAYRNENNSDK